MSSNIEALDGNRGDIVVGGFTAPYNTTTKGWMFPGGERIGGYYNALERAKFYAKLMG